jgi:cell division initiation protein
MAEQLTPVDILNQRFRRRMRGYAPAEVDEFLRRVAADMENVLKDCAAMRERIALLERELNQYRTMELTMRDALVLAQKAAEETRVAARKQAESQLQEADVRAREIEVRAQQRIADLSSQIERLHQERRRLARDLKAQLNAHLEWLAQELDDGEPETALPPAARAVVEQARALNPVEDTNGLVVGMATLEMSSGREPDRSEDA